MLTVWLFRNCCKGLLLATTNSLNTAITDCYCMHITKINITRNNNATEITVNSKLTTPSVAVILLYGN